MSDILNFIFSENAGKPPPEHIAKCREIADDVERLARAALDDSQGEYERLARKLRALADEMESCNPSSKR